MNRRMPEIQMLVPRACSLASATLLCLLLLAGCAAVPQSSGRSIEGSPLGEPSSLPPQPQSPEPVVPASRMETAAPEGGPIIAFAESIHDFGEISPSSKRICEFRFKNAGTGLLKVRDKIESTCGCAVPVLSKTEYAPGEEGVIQVTYLAGAVIGSTIKHIMVYSNDKSNGGKVTLTIKATVVERLAYAPKRLDLRLKGPNAGCPPITLRSLDSRSFSITRIVSSGGGITADFDPSIQATEFTLRPVLNAQKLQTYPTGDLVVALTHPEYTEVRIPYQTLPELQFTPPSLVLFNAEPDHAIQRNVWLSSNYGEKFEIASCASRAKMVTVTEQKKVVSEDRNSVRYRLQLSIIPPAASGTQGPVEDILAVHLTDGRVLQFACRVFCGGSRTPLPNAIAHNH